MTQNNFEPERIVKEDFISRPNKVSKREEEICQHCKQPSGWTNAMLATLSVTSEVHLKCEKCGQGCIKLMPSSQARIITDSNLTDFNFNDDE